MDMKITIITTDDAWSHHTRKGLSRRGFKPVVVSTDQEACDQIPDAILMDVSGYNAEIETLAKNIMERYPLCEWILFCSGETRWADICVVSKRAFEIVHKTADMSRVALSTLAACTHKYRAEDRLKSLNVRQKDVN